MYAFSVRLHRSTHEFLIDTVGNSGLGGRAAWKNGNSESIIRVMDQNDAAVSLRPDQKLHIQVRTGAASFVAAGIRG